MIQYQKWFLSINAFKDKFDEIDYLIQRIEISFYQSESHIISFYNEEYR